MLLPTIYNGDKMIINTIYPKLYYNLVGGGGGYVEKVGVYSALLALAIGGRAPPRSRNLTNQMECVCQM